MTCLHDREIENCPGCWAFYQRWTGIRINWRYTALLMVAFIGPFMIVDHLL